VAVGGGARADGSASSASGLGRQGLAMRPNTNDTIAAIATAPGHGAVAIVRLSGQRALIVADAVLSGTPLSSAATHTVHVRRVTDAAGRELDEVLAVVMRAPRSYTTEDVVELGCHGGSAAAHAVLDACLAAGARLARPGEFTERAFLGGRLDLVQAEAVADIVGARTRAGLAAALGQLEGALSARLADARRDLLSYRAVVESTVDFDADDIGDTDIEEQRRLGERVRAMLEELLQGATAGAAVRDGMSAVIVGRPNVGKSTLLNALLGRDRAIVTESPGTTRDVIEETLDVAGVPVRLIDTAGWRDGADAAEAAGVERSRAASRGADVVLLVFDVSVGWTQDDRRVASDLDVSRVVVVGNKCDLAAAVDVDDVVRSTRARAGVTVSAARGDGLAGLRSIIVPAGALTGETPLVTNIRHADALRRAAAAVGRSLDALTEGRGPEIVCEEVAAATDALGEVTGETTPDDVLRTIFERFCVGK